jgi:hypothetical protein
LRKLISDLASGKVMEKILRTELDEPRYKNIIGLKHAQIHLAIGPGQAKKEKL